MEDEIVVRSLSQTVVYLFASSTGLPIAGRTGGIPLPVIGIGSHGVPPPLVGIGSQLDMGSFTTLNR